MSEDALIIHSESDEPRNIETNELNYYYSDISELNLSPPYLSNPSPYIKNNINSGHQSESDSDYESQCTIKGNSKKHPVPNILSDFTKKVEEQKIKKINNKKSDNNNDKDNAVKISEKRGPKKKLKLNEKDCIKLMEIIFDQGIEKFDFYNDCLKDIVENQIKFSVKLQLIPKSIIFRRKVEEIDQEQSIGLNTQYINENHLLLIWDCQEVVNHIFNDTFVSAIAKIKSLAPNKKLSLIIYKIQNYFKYVKNLKVQAIQRNDADDGKKKKNKLKVGFSNFPTISKKKFEECLAEIQLLHNTHSRLIESQDEIIMLIQQYTKSLAMLPSKIEKDEKLSDIDWCVSCDNRDSVKIDKEGNGLISLWKQQLCQFAQSSLETSEAIVTIYKSPLQLIEAYSKCSSTEGEMLLRDIPIRRNAGLLTSSKKIGPELSKKIYIMFTEKDGEVHLNE